HLAGRRASCAETHVAIDDRASLDWRKSPPSPEIASERFTFACERHVVPREEDAPMVAMVLWREVGGGDAPRGVEWMDATGAVSREQAALGLGDEVRENHAPIGILERSSGAVRHERVGACLPVRRS